LSFDEMRTSMEGIMEGQWTPAQIAGFLVALRIKGETPEEIAAAATVLREKSVTVPVHRDTVDTCGTGGDGSGTFNISTAAAIVAAGAGVAVAKHGNRAVSSRCGSANVLQTLGVNLDWTPEQSGRCIDEVGVAFLFAPKLHPAMKHVIGPRQELGQRTLFNILGPLLNPARAKRQVIGVFHHGLTRALAETLQRLDSTHVWVVAGTDGLDEISLCAPTKVAELKEGHIHEFILNPEDLGFSLASPEDLMGGDAEQNAAIIRAILAGEKGPKRDIVVLNAGACLHVGGKAPSLDAGIALAKESLDSGAAANVLKKWISFNPEAA
jgi:anthranilate phosphoribosyltransferase